MSNLFKKIFKKENLLLFLLFIFLFLIKEINYLFYDTKESPDFPEYFIYLEHFFSKNTITLREHGLAYYYLHAANIFYSFDNLTNFEIHLHKSIQEINFYLFTLGLFGYYLLLRLYDFKKSTIYKTFILINFFPPTIALRLSFKPEILAFTLLPYIIFLIEKFIRSNEKKYLFLSIPFIVTTLTIKGNVLVIVSLYLFYKYWKLLIKTNWKLLFTFIFLVITSLFFITIENNQANGKNIFELQSGATLRKNYDFKAPPNIIYNTNLYKLMSSPIKHNHAGSFIGITLLDTFGDYFDLFWDNDGTIYSQNQHDFFDFQLSNEIKFPSLDLKNDVLIFYQQKNTDVYFYELLSLFLSVYFYYLLISYIFKSTEFRSYLIAVIFGMVILLFHAITGLPENNFDPNVGDTFKPLYYSFTLILSTIFLFTLLIKDNKLNIFNSTVYILLILNIFGFPKIYDYELYPSLSIKIENSFFCNLEKNYFLDEDFKAQTDCNESKIIGQEDSIIQNYFNHEPINLIFIFLIMFSIIYLFFYENSFLFLRKKEFS